MNKQQSGINASQGLRKGAGGDMKYEPVMGLEIHLELTTKSKMFCGCSADHFGKKPNSQTCPVCLGLPGALPYPNKKAIDGTVLLGLALGCKVPKRAKFDRKNYFYPDLPKGYQISQYDQPFTRDGRLRLSVIGDQSSVIRINRVHLEEDTARLVHRVIDGKSCSLIDFNRSGVPLVEIVSEADIHSVEVLMGYARKIRQVVRYLAISEADMEKGQLRFELNISMRKRRVRGLPPYRVEVKNINSFKFLQKAAEFEIKRQTKALREGRKLIQETRGINEEKLVTFSQRGKEEAHDYRYFPEPDIPPIKWKRSEIERLRRLLPELPEQKRVRFQKEFGLNQRNVELLVRERGQADYFEEAALEGKKRGIKVREVAKVIVNKRENVKDFSPRELVSELVKKKTRKKLPQSEVEGLVRRVLKEFPDEVDRFRKGKTGLMQFFVGQVMRKSKGAVDPGMVRKIIKYLITNS